MSIINAGGAMVLCLPATTLVYFSLSSYFSVFGHTTLLKEFLWLIELTPSALKVQSLSHWNPKE